MLTREQYVHRAAAGILRHSGLDPDSCPGGILVEAVSRAEAAINAVGAYEMYVALAAEASPVREAEALGRAEGRL
jgi:hypothetical protein